MTRKYTLYTNENVLIAALQKVVSTKVLLNEYLAGFSVFDSVIRYVQFTVRWQNNARHIVQFMICIDKGCAKKKRKNNQLKKWQNVSQELCFLSPLVWFVLFPWKPWSFYSWRKLQRESYMSWEKQFLLINLLCVHCCIEYRPPKTSARAITIAIINADSSRDFHWSQSQQEQRKSLHNY